MRATRTVRAVLGTLVVIAGTSSALGSGTIDTSSATIAAGAAPTQGTVTIEPCAPPAVPPSAPALAAQGRLEATFPESPDLGTAELGIVAIDSDTTLPGGTYDYESLLIQDGARVTYTGPVTIRATGIISVHGHLETTADGASITLLAGDGVSVLYINPGAATGIRTFGANSPILIDGDRVDVGTATTGGSTATFEGVQSEVTTVDGDITLLARGIPGGDGLEALDIQTAEIVAGNGALRATTASFALVSVSRLVAARGELVLRSLQSDIFSFVGPAFESSSGDVVIEAALGVDLADEARVSAQSGDVRVEAFQGDVLLGADGSVTATDGSVPAEPIAAGQITLRASGSVVLTGPTSVSGLGPGGVALHAHGGDVEISGDVHVTCSAGEVDLHAADDVLLGRGEGATPPSLRGSGVSVTAAAGTSMLDVTEVDATTGLLTIHGRTGTTTEGSYRSRLGISVVAPTGSLALSSATFRTESGIGAASGDITIEGFGGSAASIVATGADVRSGDNPVRSGDVTLALHAPLVDAFVLPKNVALKRNETRPERSKLKVAGFFDTGGTSSSLEGPATLSVGPLTFSGDLRAKGKQVVFDDGTVKLAIKPNRTGSSRAKFKLQARGEVLDALDPNAPLTLRFATAAADGRGTVGLEAGRYRLGKRRGTLSEPAVFPFKAQSLHKGSGKDKLAVLAGLATDGGTPDGAPDLTVRYGESFEVTIAGAELARRGDTFTAERPPSAPQVARVTLDYRRERLILKAKDLDLGPLPGGPLVVPIEVTLGADARAVEVRMVPKGRKLKY